MEDCLFEVPTVQGDGVFVVLKVQGWKKVETYWNLDEIQTLRRNSNILDISRNFVGFWIHKDIAPEIQELQEDITDIHLSIIRICTDIENVVL